MSSLIYFQERQSKTAKCSDRLQLHWILLPHSDDIDVYRIMIENENKGSFHIEYLYRDRLKGMQILQSRTQAGAGRTGKEEQEQTSRNHVQAF